jgi:sugar porter (SP) family MFS transporter
MKELVHVVVLALMSGFLYGYNTGIIAGIDVAAVNGYYNATFEYTDKDSSPVCKKNPGAANLQSVDATAHELSGYEGLFVSNILVGMTVGALIGPFLADKYGRRMALIATCANASVCAILLGVIPSFWGQVVTRTVLGISVGSIACVCPLYVTEMAPPNRRGQVGTLFQLNICSSIFVALLINYFHNEHNLPCLQPQAWMSQFSYGAIPGIVCLLYCIFFLPESDSWLAAQQAERERAGDNGGTDMNVGYGTHEIDLGKIARSGNVEVDRAPAKKANGYRLLCSSKGTKWLIICIGLPLCQQLTGINAIMFYGPQIFKSSPKPLVTTFLVNGLYNTFAVVISISLIERLGRRVLMLGGLTAMACACIMMGLSYQLSADGQGSPTISTVSIILYLSGFEAGPGPLFFLMASEAFPADVRSEALSLSNFLCNVMNIFTSAMFPVLNVAFGTGFVFMFYGAVCVVGFLFVYYMLPETKGTEKEDLRVYVNLDTGAGAAESIKKAASRGNLEGLAGTGEGFYDEQKPLMTPAGVRWTPAYGGKK